LHTVEFAEQTKDLDKHDIAATLNALQNLQGPHMVLYNCGVEAGSSQGHKHLQIMPRPSPEEFQMFPDKAKLPEGEKFSSMSLCIGLTKIKRRANMPF
jgi:ATP adenylyltransferase